MRLNLLQRLIPALALVAAAPAFAQLLSFKQLLDRPDRPQPDLRVKYGDAPQQVGELWLPKGAGPHPVVLMIHGGCWQASLPGPELLAFQADALRSAGVAVWSISYRRVGHPGGGYPGTFQDVASGTDHLRQIAKAQALDLNRLVATGHSAGGHLALWAAARPRIAAGSPLKTDAPLPIPATVAVAGIPDLDYAARNKLCGTSVDELLANAPKATAMKDTSPIELLPLHVRQTLIHGAQDRIVPPTASEGYCVRATALGDTADAVTLENAGHFELIAPWTAAGRVVVERILQAIPPAR